MFTKEVLENFPEVSDLTMMRLFQESLESIKPFIEDHKIPLRGFYVQFKGRVGGKERSSKDKFGIGVIKPHRCDSIVKYHYTNYQTKYGTSSIKVWMSLNNKNGLSIH